MKCKHIYGYRNSWDEDKRLAYERRDTEDDGDSVPFNYCPICGIYLVFVPDEMKSWVKTVDGIPTEVGRDE